LERELAPTLTYHAVAHTRDHVVPAAEKLAALEGFATDEVILVSTAAWFHDLGYIERHDSNEEIAVRMAQEVLPALGYSTTHIQTICDVIMVTRLPQTPKTRLEAVLADADFAVLGSDNILEHIQALRTEFAIFGNVYDDDAWYAYQLHFLQQHAYFTTSARRLFDPQKQSNIVKIEQLLTASRNPAGNQP
jgi:uncharacterized protein